MADFMMNVVLQAMGTILQWVRSVPTVVLAGLAWAIALLTLWNLVATWQATIHRSQEMHQIPCANCEFFTHDYRLKCTVHPHRALTEAAIGCQDYQQPHSRFI